MLSGVWTHAQVIRGKRLCPTCGGENRCCELSTVGLVGTREKIGLQKQAEPDYIVSQKEWQIIWIFFKYIVEIYFKNFNRGVM